MAVTGLLALLDDITAIMDDVAAMSKVAATKTVGIAGDDLAVNAQGLVGLDPSRELPILGRVALGSVVNKIILVPLALVLPHAVITPMLMLGGTFLCYEGVHKLAHRAGHEDEAHHDELIQAFKSGPEALAKIESGKIRQAILTDVILSAEIVAVALAAVSEQPFATKAITLSIVSLGMTAGIYGLVAVIVKLDDVGLWLQRTGAPGSFKVKLGKFLIDYTPTLMRVISVGGTFAMFLVGGGIVIHGVPGAEEWLHHAIEGVSHSGLFGFVADLVATLAVGLAIGAAALGVVEAAKKGWGLLRGAPAAH